MKTLAQQIAELDDVQPQDIDPEEDYPEQHSGDDGSSDGNNAAAREHYVSVGPSALRKNNLGLDVSDPKYSGVKTSRKHLLDSPSDSDQSDNESRSEDEDVAPDHGPKMDEDSASENSEDDSEVHSPPHSPQQSAQKEDDFTTALQQSRMADRQKGKAITRQLRFWDTIVDARIKLQKVVNSSNILPPPSSSEAFRTSSSSTSALVDSVIREGLDLADDLLALQEVLVSSQGISIPPSKRRKLNDSNTLSVEDDLTSASAAFANFEASVHAHHITTLQKWSSKVQSVAPTALLPSKRTAFRTSTQTPKSAVDLITEAIEDGSGRAKAVGRTRVRRGQAQARLGLALVTEDGVGEKGKEVAAEGDAEVFDDTDFYQEMLRDVIHAKSGASFGSDAWETARPPKIKKVVDTKASKGRKLRYEVHEKLQNFMVPVTPRGNTWHDEQIDELFASLMGKGFTTNGGHKDEPTVVDDSPIALDGLRVF